MSIISKMQQNISIPRKHEESRISSIWSNHFSAVANINQAMLFIDENKGVFTSPRYMMCIKENFWLCGLFCISIYSVYSLLRLR